MLVYIIDGFNLIYRVTSLKNSSTPHQALINYIKINKLSGSTNNKVLIVFDGNPNLAAIQQRERFEVFFSGESTADELIKKRLSRMKNKKEVVVVSDDREVRDDAKAQGARICRIDDFIKVKEKRKEQKKEISEILTHEITEEMKKIWLK